MEASVAAGSNGQQAAQGEGAGGDAGAPDFSALQERLDSFEGSQREMFEFMRSQAAAQEPGDDGDDANAQLGEMDLSFLDEAEPGYDPDEAARNLAALIQKASGEAVAAAVQPLQQKVQGFEKNQAVAALVAELPELGEPEVATKVVQTAKQYAENMGRPDLAGDPQFWKLVYLSGRAADQANAEGQEPGVAHLEGANGAVPGSGGQVDLGDAIVNAGGGGRSILPF